MYGFEMYCKHINTILHMRHLPSTLSIIIYWHENAWIHMHDMHTCDSASTAEQHSRRPRRRHLLSQRIPCGQIDHVVGHAVTCQAADRKLVGYAHSHTLYSYPTPSMHGRYVPLVRHSHIWRSYCDVCPQIVIGGHLAGGNGGPHIHCHCTIVPILQ